MTLSTRGLRQRQYWQVESTSAAVLSQLFKLTRRMTDVPVLVNLKQTRNKGGTCHNYKNTSTTSRNNITVREISRALSKPKPKKYWTTHRQRSSCNPQADHPHRTESRALGGDHCNFDSVKSQFIDAEEDVLAPAEEALENHQPKILAYQEEQERPGVRKRQVLRPLLAFAANAKSLRSQKLRRARR